ncbi:MAG TPA: hypothetical protein ENH82_17495 [bacterium]|nr:hypothetical protein [bacterium]
MKLLTWLKRRIRLRKQHQLWDLIEEDCFNDVEIVNIPVKFLKHLDTHYFTLDRKINTPFGVFRYEINAK